MKTKYVGEHHPLLPAMMPNIGNPNAGEGDVAIGDNPPSPQADHGGQPPTPDAAAGANAPVAT